MAGASPTLPPGISPPLTVDTEDDHGGLIVVITAISLFIVLTALGFRLYSWYIKNGMRKDNYAFIATVMVACTQLSVVFAQVHFGWGKTSSLVPSSSWTSMEKAGYAADIMYVSVLGLSRITALLFYHDIFQQYLPGWLHGISVLSAAGTITSIVLLAVRCHPAPWQDMNMQDCSPLWPRWQAITAMDIISEACLLIYPARVVYSLHLSPFKKGQVLSIIDCRILLIPLSAVHLRYIQIQIDSLDPSLTGSYATTTSVIHLAISVLLLIAPSIKLVIAVYEDAQGVAYTNDASNSRSKTASQPPRIHRSARNSKVDPIRRWERMEDPILPVSNNTRSSGIGNHSLELTEISSSGHRSI